MRKKFNDLTKEFDTLKIRIEQAPNISTLSINELKHYKNLIRKKELIAKALNKYEIKKEKAINSYNSKNETWLYDELMNCRKYCRLEGWANYKKEKKLYKLGYISKKPSLPFIKPTKDYISFKFIEPFSEKIPFLKKYLKTTSQNSPICQTLSCVNNFTKNKLPQHLTNLAISGTKKCIIGYRFLSNSVNHFGRNISKSPTIQFINYIKQQAIKEADCESNNFISQIKVNTQPTPVISYKISQSTSKDLDLAL